MLNGQRVFSAAGHSAPVTSVVQHPSVASRLVTSSLDGTSEIIMLIPFAVTLLSGIQSCRSPLHCLSRSQFESGTHAMERILAATQLVALFHTW